MCECVRACYFGVNTIMGRVLRFEILKPNKTETRRVRRFLTFQRRAGFLQDRRTQRTTTHWDGVTQFDTGNLMEEIPSVLSNQMHSTEKPNSFSQMLQLHAKCVSTNERKCLEIWEYMTSACSARVMFFFFLAASVRCFDVFWWTVLVRMQRSETGKSTSVLRKYQTELWIQLHHKRCKEMDTRPKWVCPSPSSSVFFSGLLCLTHLK